MTEVTVSTRLEPETKAKLVEKAISDGLDISRCLKMLVYEYLGLKTNLHRDGLLNFGLQIGDYKIKRCKHNVNGICQYWFWKKEDMPEDLPVKFVELQDDLFVENGFHSEAVYERCAFCHAYEQET